MHSFQNCVLNIFSIGTDQNLVFYNSQPKNEFILIHITMQQQIWCHHGSLSQGKEWKQPKLIAKSEHLSRPGYSHIKAHQFQDRPETLNQKIQLLASLINSAANCVVYTGAGISRASGIADYATKATNSIAGKQNPSLNRLQALPTTAHYKKKKVKHWVQQNHDGLAQKAGFPLSKLNEIHGSWFDKKNPVVLMDDCLNPKNYKLLEEWQEKVDLCLSIGTSLCGMRSDGIAVNALKRGKLVVINLQQTPYDEKCDLRIFGNLQDVIQELGKKMGIKITKRVSIQNPYQWKKQ